MKTHFDIEKRIAEGTISNKLDYERALIADRSLRLLAKEDVHFKKMRAELRDLIAAFEKQNWANSDEIDVSKVVESDQAEKIAELERLFIQKRKEAILDKLKDLKLTQEDLAKLLGHRSKTHMSELINGIKPFALKDLVVIHRLLQINIDTLIPAFLSLDDEQKIKAAARFV
ncbi:helix-turn-helix transcriptional regulator [Sphingobacterium sp. MYb382]|uniref:helix-turn-helix transcriptional regulator n=1 Tax=Sphingobacterium sp. MYb382 TaxID=2745278 RepID=UPI0030B45567